MLIAITFESDIPIYLQLREQIIIGIASGELQPGEALPSVRRMASDIGINLHTVNKTYAMLKEEGYITIDRRRGTEVAKPSKPNENFSQNLESSLTALAAQAKCKQMNLDDFTHLASTAFKNLTLNGGKKL